MRGWWVVAALALGCGAPAVTPQTPDDAPPVLEEAAGVRLLALPRPTPGQVWLALWLDAGARDASPPQVATLAAWATADPEFEARTLADATEFSMVCSPQALRSCLARLASVLSTREVQGGRLAEAFERLRQARAATRADLGRSSDALALEALLGQPTDPLGGSADDEQVEESDLNAWLSGHFGTNRALVVAVGDVTSDQLSGAAREAFSDVPEASREREAPRTPATGAEVEVGNGAALSLATVFAEPGSAVQAGQHWVARMHGDANAAVFPLRGGTALLLRHGVSPGGSGALRDEAATMLDRLEEVREEEVREEQMLARGGWAVAPEDPRALARWHGAQWAAGRGGDAGGLGFGAVVDGGRGDRLSGDPDRQLATRAQGLLREVLERTPDISGAMEEDRAELRLGNGARIRARRLAGTENLAVTVLFEGGGWEETARGHGLTALLAAVSVGACRRAAPSELGVHPDALGIHISTLIESERFGFSVSGPRARWPQVSYLAGRCARPERLDPSIVETARLSLSSPSRSEAALAVALSPGAPGRIASLPATPPVAGVDELTRWRDRLAVGARASVGIAGDAPLELVVRRLARLAGAYPAGASAASDTWEGPSATLLARPAERTGAWIVRSAEAESNSLAIVTAYTVALARRLSADPRLRVISEHRGVFGGRAVAAVLVHGDEATLAQLPDLVPDVPTPDALPDPPGPPTTPTAASISLARGTAEDLSANASLALWGRLDEAPPTFVMLRPAR